LSNLEQNPLQEVKAPSYDWLVQENKLPPDVEVRCETILARLRKIMREKRIPLESFFKDYDKVDL
jgi:hypothetical protein